MTSDEQKAKVSHFMYSCDPLLSFQTGASSSTQNPSRVRHKQGQKAQVSPMRWWHRPQGPPSLPCSGLS